MERDFGPIEDGQQLSLVGMKPGQQPIERGKAGAALEDTVKARLQLGLAAA